MFLFDLQVWYC